MNHSYSLLYVPLLGLTALCLVGCWKLVKDRRKHSHDRLWSVGLALLGLALGTSGLGVMVITHVRAFSAAADHGHEPHRPAKRQNLLDPG